MAGFFCRAGTGDASKTRDNCPQTYYCPKGTGVYSYVQDVRLYNNWKTDAPTRCPRGTGQDNADTKTRITECFIDVEYKLLIFGIDMRSVFDQSEDVVVAEEEEESTEEKEDGESGQSEGEEESEPPDPGEDEDGDTGGADGADEDQDPVPPEEDDTTSDDAAGYTSGGSASMMTEGYQFTRGAGALA